MSLFRAPLFALIVTGMWVGGCVSTKPTSNPPEEEQRPPTMEIVNWLPPGSRVAMLPIYTAESVGAAMKDMDAIFRSQLIGELPFEVVQIGRPELQGILHREQIPSTEAISPAMFRAFREKYGVDAVVFTDFTVYRPYRPIAIGVRSKLVSMDTLEVLWAADHVYDSADPATAEAAVRFADPASNVPSDRANQVTLQSPRRYAAFVAHEIYTTLPPR